MTILVRAFLGALVVTALASTQQPRDGTVVARIGTGLVTGLVTLGDDAITPVRRAVVTLTAADGGEKLSAISGDDGRFMIQRVPAGRYLLAADKPAHVTVSYGAHRPGRRGTMLIVEEGQRLDDLTLSLPRGAVLAGRITLPDGQALPNVEMVAIPSWLASDGGMAETGARREFRTDELGEFRLFGLAPDTYVLAALPSFGDGSVERLSDATITDMLRQLQQSENRGASLPSSATVTYAPTYFPGTPLVADAIRVTVGPGQVRDDLTFTVTPFPAATIRGRVVGSDGTPQQAVALTLEAVGPSLSTVATGTGRINTPNRNGEFEIRGVSPGMYRLRARGGDIRLDANGAATVSRGDAQTQFAMTELSVAGFNVDGIVLTLHEGYRLSGTLTADSSAASPALTGASVTVRPITNGPISVLAGVAMPGVASRDATVDGVGRFAVTGLEPLNYEIRVTLPAGMASAGWHIENITCAGRDLRDSPLTFAESLDGVTIRLTTAVTELRGRLTTESGMAATDYFIIAFPADRALWHPASPRVRVLRPAVDGKFSTQDLPPGAYRLAVLTDIEEHEPRRREFLESIYNTSVDVSLTAGRTTERELRISRDGKH